MTLGIGVILAIVVSGLALVAFGICKDQGEPVVMGLIALIIAAVGTGARYENIENERRYDLCVKHKKEVVKVLGHEVCKL